jgi:hypothetical protein
MFFSKEDEKNLRKLLQKVKGQADGKCATAGAHGAKEEAALKAVVGKYKLTEADMEGARPCLQRGIKCKAAKGPRARNPCWLTRTHGCSRVPAPHTHAALYKWRHSNEF